MMLHQHQKKRNVYTVFLTTPIIMIRHTYFIVHVLDKMLYKTAIKLCVNYFFLKMVKFLYITYK